jgi:hypothetical protein
MPSSMDMKPSFTLTLDTSILQRRLFSYSSDEGAVTPNGIVLGVFMPNVFLFLQLGVVRLFLFHFQLLSFCFLITVYFL